MIVLFSTFAGMIQGEKASVTSFINVPFSIFSGVVLGLLIGIFLHTILKKYTSGTLQKC